ncbi:hypothetical protein [Candidatus Albibeggiatoa sp. nov. NOAA]|uniref:hypothetical protein n=1 Tax=Candidatus Albibeggiatoa sp. nov. NOAA TaxID=3162724 RepID=UPI0032FEFBAD|nr:hypothetical protein [Thiotrichaceae bacterium]
MSAQSAQSLQEQEALANKLLDNGKGLEATQVFQTLIASNPPNIDWLYYQLGKAYGLDQRWPKAAESFMQALKLNPQLAIAAVAFGDVSVTMKAYEEAEKAYLHALKFKNVHPELAQSYLRLGEILVNNKQYEFALHAYKNTSDLDKSLRPQLIGIYKTLIDTLTQKNKVDLAQQVIKRVKAIEEELAAEQAATELDENELLLLQLHQTQEELETLFFKNDKLEKANTKKQKQLNTLEQTNAEIVSKLTEITTERDEQAKLAANYQNKIEQIEKEKKEMVSKEELVVVKKQNTELSYKLEQSLYELKQLEKENQSLVQRQHLLDGELLKAEAHVELITDILIREKHF